MRLLEKHRLNDPNIMIYKRKPNRKTFIYVFLIVIISAIYLWYFFIYIKNNENLLTAKGYRILSRIENNIKSKLDDQHIRLKNYGISLNESTEYLDFISYDDNIKAFIQFVTNYINSNKNISGSELERIISSYSSIAIQYNNYLKELSLSYPEKDFRNIDQCIECYISNSIEEIKKLNDAYKSSKNDTIGFINVFFKNEFENSKRALSNNFTIVEEIKSKNLLVTELDKENIIIDKNDSTNFTFQIIPQYEINIQDTQSKKANSFLNKSQYPYYLTFPVEQNNYSENNQNEILSIKNKYYMPLRLFMIDIVMSDFFDEIAIFTHPHNEKEKTGSPIADFTKLVPVYNTKDSHVQKDMQISNCIKDTCFIGPFSYNIRIADVSYKALVKPVKIYDLEFIIVGYANKNMLDRKAKSINPYILLLISSAIVLLIFAFPFFKLFLLNKNERLTASDIYFSAISLIFGSAFLLFFIVNLYNHFFVDRYTTKKNLSVLSNTINKEFKSEICNAYNQLILSKNLLLKYQDVIYDNNIIPLFTDTLYKSSIIDKNNEFLFIGDDGRVKLHASYGPQDKSNSLNVFVNNREYFNRVVDNDMYRIIRLDSSKNSKLAKGICKVIKKDTIHFFLQSLYSWKTGKPEVVISRSVLDSIPGIKVSAIAIENFKSLFNPILPLGYQFCIIDKNGEVQFHSDIKRNLRENFFKEVGERNRLLSAIHSDIPEYMELRYNEEIQRVFVSPIHGMNMSLVVMHSATITQLQNFMIILYCIAIWVAIMFLIIIITLIVKIVSHKETRLKTKHFSYSWLLPIRWKSKYIYKINLNYILIVVETLILFTLNSILAAVLFHAFIILFTSITNFYLFESKDKDIIENNYFQNVFKDLNSKLFAHQLIHWLLILFIIVLLYHINKILILIIISILLIFYISSRSGIKFLTNNYGTLKTKKLSPLFGFYNAYTKFVFTWLIIVAIIPTLWYYRINTLVENDTWGRASMFYMGNKIEQLFKTDKEKNLNNVQFYADNLGYEIIKNDSSAYNKFKRFAQKEESLDSIQNNFFEDLRVGTGPLYFDGIYIPIINMVENNRNTIMGWIKKNDYINYAKVLFFEQSDSEQYFVINKAKSNLFRSFFKLPIIEIISFTFVALFGIFIYLLFVNWVTKMLANKALNQKLYKIFSSKALYDLGILKNNRRYFITSPPGSGLTRKLVDLYRKDKRLRTLVIDLHKSDYSEEIDKIEKGRIEVIIIKSFDYNLFNFEKNKVKIELFEILTQKQDLTVLVRSAVEIDYLFELYDKCIHECQARGSEYASYVIELDKWESLFRNFIQLHLPMDCLKEQYVKDVSDYGKEKDILERSEELYSKLEINYKEELDKSQKLWTLKELINQMQIDELKKYTCKYRKNDLQQYLKVKKNENINVVDIKDSNIPKVNLSEEEWIELLEDVTKKEFDIKIFSKKVEEKLIFQVQRLANTYYHSIWNNCSNSEKLLIYDLAEDGLLNSSDTLPLKNLYHKGIILFDEEGRPCLFNKSFANFILESSKIEEAKSLELEYSKQGDWSTYKVVLITIIFALVVFFILAEDRFLSQFSAISSMILAVIPALIRASQGLLSLNLFKSS